MTNPARGWRKRQELFAERKPRLRIDSSVLSEGEKGYYDVVIEGIGLLPALTPPHITVGGVTLEQAKFEQGGRQVRGVLRERPKDDKVVVDLGYASTESRLEKQSGSE